MTRRRATFALLLAAWVLAGPVSPAGGGEASGIASITFCSKVGKSSGKAYGEARSFVLEEGRRVHARVEFDGLRPREERILHLLWTDPDGRRVFRKRVVLMPEEPRAWVTTNLSLSPERREPGTYRLRVFLYRMLVADGTVELTAQLPQD